MAKATGAEITEFWQHGFPDGYYSDDCETEVMDDKGECVLEPSEKYDLGSFGNLYPDNWAGGDHDAIISFSSAFARWKKAKTTETLIVEVPKSEVESFKQLAALHKYKIKK